MLIISGICDTQISIRFYSLQSFSSNSCSYTTYLWHWSSHCCILCYSSPCCLVYCFHVRSLYQPHLRLHPCQDLSQNLYTLS